MSFVRSYGFVFYFALFFWTVDLLAMVQADDDKIVRTPPPIAHLEKGDDGAHEMESSRGNFALLPDEVILLIFKLLSRQDLGRLASVSRAMQQLSEDDSLWRPIAAKRGFPISVSNSALLSVKQMFRESLSLRRQAWVEKFLECR